MSYEKDDYGNGGDGDDGHDGFGTEDRRCLLGGSRTYHKMAEEFGLSGVQREKTYQANLYYLNGINSYRDLGSRIWKQRNSELKDILTSAQWKRYKNVSGLYRPVSWRGNSYVHNFSDNRQPM